MKVREFMSPDPLTVGAEATVGEALERMRERNVWSPVVLKDGEILGFLTERDILHGIIAPESDPAKVKVEEVMSRRYGVLHPDENYSDAARTMMKAKGRLVVLDEGELVGVVTAADIVRAYASSATSGPPLRPHATWKVLKIHGQASVKEAVRIMNAERVGSLLIEEEGVVKGIFTERDAVRKFLLSGGDPYAPVREFATMELVTLSANSTLLDAAKLMSERRIKRLPLVERGEVAGIITARDIVEAIWKITTQEEMLP